MRAKNISQVFLICLLLMAVTGCMGTNVDSSNRSRGGNNSGITANVQASSDDAHETGETTGAVLASFTTKYAPQDKARSNNIKLAAAAINEKTIQPGEEFSYNNAVGPTTSERGYMEAKIFVDGKEERGYGGGVCQVSSTLYNAVEKAELETTERHEHSKKVYYVKPDMDAATSYGKVDYKFKNTKDYPIIIKSYTNKGSVTVDILEA